MKVVIGSIKNYPNKISDILTLHKVNSRTLGFLPAQAFNDASAEDRILIAYNDEDGILLGYLLFAINKGSNFIYITHLCVSLNYRNLGIAKKLVMMLVKRYESDYRGIRVTCREDYEATKIWEKLNFTFSHEKPGRSKVGSNLFIWWLNFHHLDLFTPNYSPRIKVALDSNIIYDLMEPKTPKTQNSHALLSDWLTEDVEYYVTDQLNNDISHNKDKDIRILTKNFASRFKSLVSGHDNVFIIENDIKKIYNKKLSQREESDIKHIAKTIDSEATYFLTKDSGILKHSKILNEKYSLVVLKPEEFIIKFSALINEKDYQPYRLAGTSIQKKKLTIEELNEIPSTFFYSSNEKKKEFESKLMSSLVKKHTSTFAIKISDTPTLFYSIFEDGEKVEVEYLRYIKNINNKTILNQIIHDLIYDSRKNNKKLLCVSEKYVDVDLESILLKFSFIKINNSYYRFVSDKFIEFNEVYKYLSENIENDSLRDQYLNKLSPFLKDKINSFQIEKYLFPLKIIDSEMHCFIVPIQSQWAANLFSSKMSSQDLFGGDFQLLLNKENAYYRSATPHVLKNNSRVLWYVSKGTNRYYDAMKISASSYLNEIEIDRPKILYKKFQRLGIYRWQDVLKTAKKNITKEIMAFNFELTENFNSPISRIQLADIYRKNLNMDFFSPQAPYKIPENVYFEIYKKGWEANHL